MSSDRQKLFDALSGIPDLIESRFIDIMPQEERENRFQVVLDNISDGVFSIGKDSQITTINKMALRALNHQAQHVLGKNVSALNLLDHTIVDLSLIHI